MSSDAPHSVRALLRALEEGDGEAGSELFKLLYAELHERARSLTHQRPKPVTLQATALVHEAYVRLVGEPGRGYRDRDHFLACASRAMKNVLVDHARRHRSGGGAELLDAVVAAFEERALDIEGLALALEELTRSDPEMAQAVELRFFGGASEEETARILGIPLRSLQRRWKGTRAWLRRRFDAG
jgi:RNA polymerase sigma factor (TIGR02999 family)